MTTAANQPKAKVYRAIKRGGHFREFVSLPTTLRVATQGVYNKVITI